MEYERIASPMTIQMALNIASGSTESSLTAEEEEGTVRTEETAVATGLSGASGLSVSASASASPVAATTDEIAKFGRLLPFKLKDVVLSENEDQPTVKGKRNVNTKLVGIGDIKTIDIDSKHLRNWGNREGVGLRAGTKAAHCVAIVAYTTLAREMAARGQSMEQPETIFARTKVNFVRFINVLSHGPVKAALVNNHQIHCGAGDSFVPDSSVRLCNLLEY